MSELARTYLRQARSFVNLGDTAKAAELLERAAVLVRDDATLNRQITEELAGAYDRLGRQADAQRLHLRLEQMAPAPVQAPVPSAAGPLAPPPLPRRRRGMWAGIGGAVAALIAIGVGVWIWNTRPIVSPLAPVQPAASTAGLPPAAGIAASPPPSPPPTSSPTTAMSREGKLKENVAMVLVVLRYAGPSGGKQEEWRIPLGSGTAFAVSQNGLLLTNRHVIDSPQDTLFPASLDELGKPTVTLRERRVMVCFSQDPADRFEAEVISKSDTHDLAILKVNRTFAEPLKLSFVLPHQGEDVVACGFPGAVGEVLNRSSQTPEAVRNHLMRYTATGRMDLIDTFSPDSFRSTLTRGIVSQPERNISGSSYIQIDASVAEGNSGGPVLNARDEVIGIVTSGIQAGKGNYNFALRMDQIHDELQVQGVIP